jgi:hypothetical protein
MVGIAGGLFQLRSSEGDIVAAAARGLIND